MDPNFGLQLRGKKIQERIHSLRKKPEELMKLVNESAALESFSKIFVPGVSKGCCLEAFKFLRASKKHSFVSPG